MASERRKPNFKNIIFIIVFVISFVAALFYAQKYLGKRHTVFPEGDGVCVVLMGDSNVAICHFEGTMEGLISDITGYEVYNMALGGTTAANIDEDNQPDEYYDKCCLYNLINLPITGANETYLDNPHKLNQYYEDAKLKINTLGIIDFERVDYLVLTFGINDYFSAIPYDNMSDKYDVTSYGGAMRSSIEKIHSYYPNLKIIVTTPTYCYVNECQKAIPAYDYDMGGGKLKDYMDVCYGLEKDYDYVYLVDMYHKLGVNEYNYQNYMSDNLHIWGIAQKAWCDIIAKKLQSIEGR